MTIICTQGCCAGCQDCYGYGIGCHQVPCRCDQPCTCRWADEDADPGWRAGCGRHDTASDRRGDYDPDPPDAIEMQTLGMGPCPVCGESGACGADDEGRALIHAVPGDVE